MNFSLSENFLFILFCFFLLGISSKEEICTNSEAKITFSLTRYFLLGELKHIGMNSKNISDK